MDGKKIIEKSLDNLVDFQMAFKMCSQNNPNNTAQKLNEMTDIHRFGQVLKSTLKNIF